MEVDRKPGSETPARPDLNRLNSRQRQSVRREYMMLSRRMTGAFPELTTTVGRSVSLIATSPSH
jgi:hypothetical protein